MSMLSAQCDELRELATRYDELQAGAVKAVKMPSNMGPILRDAADTIWELRGSVHRERAEADRLRELVRIAVKHCDSGTCDGCPIMCDDESCPYSDMARELGVEVDE